MYNMVKHYLNTKGEKRVGDIQDIGRTSSEHVQGPGFESHHFKEEEKHVFVVLF